MMAANNDLEGIKQYKKHHHNLNHSDYDGRTPLHIAAAYNSTDVMAYLIRHNVESRQDNYGTSPLDEAFQHDHAQVYLQLMEYLNQDLTSAFVEAVKVGKNNIAITLWDTSDVHLSNNDTALHVAVRHNNLFVLQHYMQHLLLDEVNDDGESAIVLAQKKGIDVNKLDVLPESLEQPFQPTHACVMSESAKQSFIAVANKDLAEMKRLKRKGAIFTCTDYDGRSLLHLAVSNDDLQMCKFLVPYCDIHIKDKFGKSPLDEAMTHIIIRNYLESTILV